MTWDRSAPPPHTRGYERQIEILKEFGVNSIRTSHNPPAPEVLDLCDKMGILVIDELFDVWQCSKEGVNNESFNEWHERDVVNLCHRDRNHPCVIAWSSGNEVPEQGMKNLHHISQTLTDLFHREDPTRKVTSGCNNANAARNGFGDTLDVYGYNLQALGLQGLRQGPPPPAVLWCGNRLLCQLPRRILLPRGLEQGQGILPLPGQFL